MSHKASAISHKAILASAGSGKTFQLAHRYIRILAEGCLTGIPVAPDRICAMTFTRKAAGEILDSIAEYLRISASDEKAAAVTARDRIGMPDLTRADFLKLLRLFIDDLHRARIGTLDSFIVGIAKAFPVELGIPMGFQVVDSESAAARENRRMVLERILGPAGARDVGKNFLSAFKIATYGHEEKTFGSVLDSFLDRMRSQYRLCPDGRKWGNEDLIWPGRGRPLRLGRNDDLRASASAVVSWAKEKNQKVYRDIIDIAHALENYVPASAWEGAFDNTVFSRLLRSFHALEKGDVDIVYGSGRNNVYVIPADIAGHLYNLMYNMMAIEFDRVLRRTVGTFELLNTYEHAYEEITRSAGSFSFTDIQYLLTGPSAMGGGRLISRERGGGADDEGRLYIDYRMDCRLDHWLLDEFQDTSDLQWAVFENLVSEILQAPASENRSFFYVGDVKQAIYRWRGGNHELFHDIIDKFNKNGIVIELEPMQETRRCSQPVIDTVNRTFGALPEELPADAVKKWAAVWEDHKTAVKNSECGYAAILEPAEPVASSDSASARCMLVADLLNEIKPVKRGIETGILVRSNDFGRQLVDFLRKECPEMSFVHEGEAAITDNEVAHVLLALVTLAAHPSDEYAWKYIQMTPMSGVLKELKIGRSNIAPRLLAEIQEDGFQRFVRNWGTRLDGVCKIGQYGRYCLDRFESAAAEFDALGIKGCNGFLRFMDDYTIRDQPSSSAVRVMTVHQSKGLEFDMVIIPQLQGGGSTGNMARESKLDLICAGGRSDPDWILKMPKRIIAENVTEFNKQLEAADAEHCYDSLCTLYVAMTRAKRGLYFITTTGRSAPSTLNAAVFLKEQLTGRRLQAAVSNVRLSGSDYAVMYECGTGSEWYKHNWPEKELEVFENKELLMPSGYAGKHDRCRMLHHREPSGQRGIVRNASLLFESRSTDIMDFGSAIHELLEQVEWAEDADVDAIVAQWEKTSVYGADVTKDVIIQFRECMKSEAVRKCLSRPDGAMESPWLEKRFEVIIKNELLSGAFDRVTIVRDGDGKPVSASIIDYKSSVVDTDDKIKDKIDDYTPQMTAYRDALSVILGIPKDRISLYLLFTRQQQLHEII